MELTDLIIHSSDSAGTFIRLAMLAWRTTDWKVMRHFYETLFVDAMKYIVGERR